GVARRVRHAERDAVAAAVAGPAIDARGPVRREAIGRARRARAVADLGDVARVDPLAADGADRRDAARDADRVSRGAVDGPRAAGGGHAGVAGHARAAAARAVAREPLSAAHAGG